MSTSQNTDRTSELNWHDWKYSWPGFSLFTRLVVFAILAQVWSWVAGRLIDMDVLPVGQPWLDSLISASAGRYLSAVFWALIIAVIVRRIIKQPKKNGESRDSCAFANVAPASGKESPQEAQLRLSAEMQAVSNWMEAMRFLWEVFKISFAIFLLISSPELLISLFMFYGIWRGWQELMNARRRKIWASAGQRQFEAVPFQTDQVNIERKKYSRIVLEKIERMILWLAISPMRVAVGYLVRVAEMLAVIFNIFTNIKLIERTFLYVLIQPLRWMLFALQQLSEIWWFVKQICYDSAIVIVLWCVSIFLAASIGS